MSDIQWPDSSDCAIVIIIDASHEVEERALENWVEHSAEESGYVGEITLISVPISRSPEEIPLENLEELSGYSPETVLVPVRMLWLHSATLSKSIPSLTDIIIRRPKRPGKRKAKRILTQNPEHTRPIAGKSATIAELSESLKQLEGEQYTEEQFAAFVGGRASLALDIAERSYRGGRYKVPRRVADSLKSSREFKQSLELLSKETGRSISDLRSESESIMKELIAIPKAFYLDLMGLFTNKITTLAYDSDIVVNKKDLERNQHIVSTYPTAFLWTHKTHVDGFAMNRILYENDFPSAHTFGGINMAFAGLGYFGRRAGGIFIRRTFQDNPLYKLILKHYIGYLMEKRFPFSWSFEGTRSRVGKLMPPKFGLLKYILEAAQTTNTKNLHIIPVAINYDLIGDAVDYAKEQSGGSKRPESLRWFIGYLRGLRQPMGRIYMDFGEPVVLAEPPADVDHISVSKIAFQVGVEANRVTPLTLASLATMVLLAAAPKALTSDELVAELVKLGKWARARKIRITADFDPKNIRQPEAVAQFLINKKLVTQYDEGKVRLYAISPEQQTECSYYRNTTIHYFVVKAIAELALLGVSRKKKNPLKHFWNEAEKLRDLYKFEFFYAPTNEFKDQVREELAHYDAEWEEKLDTKPGYAATLLSSLKPLVAHATLTHFTEAYLIVSAVLSNRKASESLDEKDCIAECFTYGRQAYLQRRVRSMGSIGKLLFQNGYKLMQNYELTEGGDESVAEQRAEMYKRLRKIINRLERIRSRALPV